MGRYESQDEKFALGMDLHLKSNWKSCWAALYFTGVD
jgi:hypothetical protein